MSLSTYPPVSSGGLASAIKSIQRGSASVAGTITIASVDTTKTTVTSYATGSGGSASITGGLNAQNISLNGVSGTFPGRYSFGANQSSGANAYYVPTSGQNGTYASTLQTVTYSAPVNQLFSVLSQSLNAQNGSASAANFNVGTSTIAAITYGASLTNATTITVTGPCNWQVVEYN